MRFRFGLNWSKLVGRLTARRGAGSESPPRGDGGNVRSRLCWRPRRTRPRQSGLREGGRRRGRCVLTPVCPPGSSPRLAPTSTCGRCGQCACSGPSSWCPGFRVSLAPGHRQAAPDPGRQGQRAERAFPGRPEGAAAAPVPGHRQGCHAGVGRVPRAGHLGPEPGRGRAPGGAPLLPARAQACVRAAVQRPLPGPLAGHSRTVVSENTPEG